MDKIDEKIIDCNKCGQLIKPRTCFFKKGKTNLLVIGESPAKDGWLVSGKAFYNKDNKLQATGKVLNKLLNLIGLDIEDINFTECSKCYIEDRKQLYKCGSNCKTFLIEQINKCDCNLVLTMGLLPTEILLNQKIGKLSEVVGKSYELNYENKQVVLIPIYHCSPINPLSFTGNKDIFLSLKEHIVIKKD